MFVEYIDSVCPPHILGHSSSQIENGMIARHYKLISTRKFPSSPLPWEAIEISALSQKNFSFDVKY